MFEEWRGSVMKSRIVELVWMVSGWSGDASFTLFGRRMLWMHLYTFLSIIL